MGSDSYSELTEDFGLAKVADLLHFTCLFSYMRDRLGDLGIILPKNQNHSVSIGCAYAANKADSLFTAWLQNILQSILQCLCKCAFKGYGTSNGHWLDACLRGAMACVVRVHVSAQGFGTS